MSENTLGPMDQRAAPEELRSLLLRTVELERELMKAKRVEKVLLEMEQRYLSLMDSSVFLHLILSSRGVIRVMNRYAEEFFGIQFKTRMEVTLQSLVGPGYAEEADALLKEASTRPIHVTLPVARGRDIGWLDMELCVSSYQGEPSVQVIALDVTGLVKDKAPSRPSASGAPSQTLQILNSCPGLLCFAVDKSAALLYATRGYREVAGRLLGHECVTGSPYPAGLETAFDRKLHELIRSAFSGETDMTALVEQKDQGDNHWNITTAPLLSSQGEITGAVALLTSLGGKPAAPPPSAAPDEKLLRQDFLNSIPNMVVVLDAEGRCVGVNDFFLETLKLKREELLDRKFSELLIDSDPQNANFADRLLAVNGRFRDEVDCRICTRDGEIFHWLLKGAPVQWEGGTRTLFSCTDNTRLRRTEEQLKRVATTDVSTGTLNRQGMERVLCTEIERASRYRGTLSLIMLDIDGFRLLNERIGYAASDHVLRDLAVALKSRIRATDFLGRWGGDEFMILTPSSPSAALLLAEKLRDMAEYNTFGENNPLSLSAGVAEYRKGMDVSAFVACAYDAMTAAKRSGGNRCVQAPTQEPDDAHP